MKRRVFFSFHYALDYWRTGQVRGIGAIEGNTPVAPNDWETVKGGGRGAIQRWIDRQMGKRKCAIVLVGAQTADRHWIAYEIRHAWETGMGVVGIRVHGLADSNGRTTARGRSPFVGISVNGVDLGTTVKCYDPPGANSSARYRWISDHLSDAVEEAIRIRRGN